MLVPRSWRIGHKVQPWLVRMDRLARVGHQESVCNTGALTASQGDFISNESNNTRICKCCTAWPTGRRRLHWSAAGTAVPPDQGQCKATGSHWCSLTERKSGLRTISNEWLTFDAMWGAQKVGAVLRVEAKAWHDRRASSCRSKQSGVVIYSQIVLEPYLQKNRWLRGITIN